MPLFTPYNSLDGRPVGAATPLPYMHLSVAAGVQTVHTNGMNSDVSVRDTIHLMASIARASARSMLIAQAIKDAIKDLDSRASDAEICRAIFYWIKSHISFVEDETTNQYLGMTSEQANDTELLITPESLLSMNHPQGDCDDFSTLCASMLLALGFHCAFVTIAADSTMPKMLSHVYVKAWLEDENRGLYMDCSHGPVPGWEHSAYTRKVEWGIN